jgi:hypothetical protein
MSTIVIELDEGGGSARQIAVAFADQETAGEAIVRLERAHEFEHSAVLDAVVMDIPGDSEKSRLVEILWPAQPIRLQRIEVEVHFESHVRRHHFPVHARWARVHRWAVHVFNIAADAAVHLELHEDTPTGPVLNERQEIGPHPHHKTVWLVKPGPEPNG